MSTRNLLEAWAYIMIILVCFTILLTFIVCFLVRFIKKRRRRREEQQQIEKEANRSIRHSKYQSAAVNKHESHFGSISSLLFSCTVCSKPTPRANNSDSDNEKERHSSMNEKQLVNTTAIKAENNDKINYDYDCDEDEDKDETRNMKNGEVIINETSKKRIDYLNINRINNTINNNNDTSRSGVITKSAASSKIRNPNSTNNRQNAAIGIGINQIQTMQWKNTITNTNNITRKPEKLNNSVNYNMIYQNQQLQSNKKFSIPIPIPIQDEDQIETTMNQTSPNSNSVFRFIYDKLKLDMWLKRIEPEIIIEQKPKQKSLDIQERFVLVDDEDEENRGNIFKSSRRKLPQLPVGNKDQRRNSSLPMSHHSVKFKPIEIGSIETPTASSIDSGGRNYDDDENYDSFYDQSATNVGLAGAGSCSSDENENSSQIPATSSTSRRKYSTCSSSLAAPSNKLSGNKHWHNSTTTNSSAYSSCTSRKNSLNSNFSVFEQLINKNSRKQSCSSSSSTSQQHPQQQITITKAPKLGLANMSSKYRSYQRATSDYSSMNSQSSDLQSPGAGVVKLFEPNNTSNSKTKRLIDRAVTTDVYPGPLCISANCSGSGGYSKNPSGGIQRGRLLSQVMQSPRRFSSNSEGGVEPTRPFWVPPEIAQRAKPRCSLPNTHLSEVNETYSPQYSPMHFNDMSLKMEKLASASPSTAARLRDLERLDRRESNSSVPVSNRNGSITGIAYPVSNRRRASMFDPIDPTELQKTLYQTKVNNKSPNDSNSSDASLGGESIGTVEFGLQYVSDLQKLVVDLVRVFDLQFKQQAIEADQQQQQQQQQPIEIYCKCTLLPDKLSFQTKMVKRSANPIFEQQFDFDYLDLAKMDSRFLEISIHECDAKFNRDDCIGVTTLKLNLPNIETKNMFLRDFKPWIRNGEENYIGDLMFSLAYLPTAERLTVVIMKARNLNGIGTDKKTAPDPYVKVSISNLDGSKKSKKKKTSTQKSTTSPIYNEEIVFTNIKKEKLNDIQLQLVVYHDSLTHREELGCVTVGSMSKSNEYIQFKDMCDGKKSIAWWQTLKSTAGHNHQCNHQSNNDSESSQPNVHTSSTAASKRSSINAKLRKFLARSTSINR